MINETATTLELSSFSSIKSLNKKPRIKAGITPIIVFIHMSMVSFFRDLSTSSMIHNFFQKYINTDPIAPTWINISKVLENFSSEKVANSFTRIRCPVLDTGKNSVNPSTMLRMSATSHSLIGTVVCGYDYFLFMKMA